jgi:fucose 4-O-acetylase-like acetyltransferase
MLEKRLAYIDIAKGIGIILVVVGHTATPNLVHNFIYQFHMPLFFFLSGFFYHEKYDFQVKTFVAKKIKGLYFPYVKYGVLLLSLYCAINFLILDSTGYSVLGYIKTVLFLMCVIGGVPLGGALWFLKSLLFVSIFFSIVRFLLTKVNSNQRNKELLLFFVCLSGFVVGSVFSLRYNISSSLVGLLFYYIGHFYKQNEDNIKMNIVTFLMALAIVSFSAYINKVDVAYNIYTYKFLLALLN